MRCTAIYHAFENSLEHVIEYVCVYGCARAKVYLFISIFISFPLKCVAPYLFKLMRRLSFECTFGVCIRMWIDWNFHFSVVVACCCWRQCMRAMSSAYWSSKWRDIFISAQQNRLRINYTEYWFFLLKPVN